MSLVLAVSFCDNDRSGAEEDSEQVQTGRRGAIPQPKEADDTLHSGKNESVRNKRKGLSGEEAAARTDVQAKRRQLTDWLSNTLAMIYSRS